MKDKFIYKEIWNIKDNLTKKRNIEDRKKWNLFQSEAQSKYSIGKKCFGFWGETWKKRILGDVTNKVLDCGG